MTTPHSIPTGLLSQSKRIGRLGDKGRIIAMGVLLGVVSFLYFFPGSGPSNGNLSPIKRVEVAPELFLPSGTELKKVRDTAASDRVVIEPEPLQHLLKLALNMTPDIAQALEMPDQQIPL